MTRTLCAVIALLAVACLVVPVADAGETFKRARPIAARFGAAVIPNRA